MNPQVLDEDKDPENKETLVFDSSFECGNLDIAVLTN